MQEINSQLHAPERITQLNNILRQVLCLLSLSWSDGACLLMLKDIFCLHILRFSLSPLLLQVKELRAVTQRLAAEIAERITLVNALLFRAEDARLLGDRYGAHFRYHWTNTADEANTTVSFGYYSASMRSAYMELYALNRDLISQHAIRCSNHTALLTALRVVNQHIQRASRLRAGRSQTEVVSRCRLAIKNNDVPGLFKVILDGVPMI